jgi:hypothetical protein
VREWGFWRQRRCGELFYELKGLGGYNFGAGPESSIFWSNINNFFPSLPLRSNYHQGPAPEHLPSLLDIIIIEPFSQLFLTFILLLYLHYNIPPEWTDSRIPSDFINPKMAAIHKQNLPPPPPTIFFLTPVWIYIHSLFLLYYPLFIPNYSRNLQIIKSHLPPLFASFPRVSSAH